MIYLIPNWQQNDDLHANRMLHIVKLFEESQMPATLLLPHLIPFSRYQAQDYHFNGTQVRLFDLLQNIMLQEGAPLTLKDMGFDAPEMAFIYSFEGVLILQNDQKIAQASYNAYGHISHVKRFVEEGFLVDVLDDRGFVSYRDYQDTRGETFQRDYFNELGEITLQEKMQDKVSRFYVTEKGNSKLTSKDGASLESLLAEAIFHATEEKASLLFEASPSLLGVAEYFRTSNRVYTILAGNRDLRKEPASEVAQLLYHPLTLITDSFDKQDEILAARKNLSLKNQSDIFVIPMYQTTLSLGNSNSVFQQWIYLRLGNLSPFAKKSCSLLFEKVFETENDSLIFEVSSEQNKKMLENVHRKWVDERFGIDSHSEDYLKVAHFLRAKADKQLFEHEEKAMTTLKKSPQWQELVAAYKVYQRLSYRVSPHPLQIVEDFRKVRLFVDTTEGKDFQSQAQAVSAGLPMLLRDNSYFLVPGVNGDVVNTEEELLSRVNAYLENLDLWNKSLVQNVELIELYSTQSIAEIWKEVLSA
ncbi:MAG: accessory Sec system protein Asp1 [Streptococcaceae bacterium]|jgi:accessory secretory protein Asp1|nr:accessory Sec system protein Asp1 [Streptococcaceae bacterium]